MWEHRGRVVVDALGVLSLEVFVSRLLVTLVTVLALAGGVSAQAPDPRLRAAPTSLGEVNPVPTAEAPIDRVVFEHIANADTASTVVGYAGARERLRLAVSGPANTPAPQIAGDTLFACVGAQLYFIDVTRAVVRKRLMLAGECTSLRVEGDRATIGIVSGERGTETRLVVREADRTRMGFPKASSLFAMHQLAQLAPGSDQRTLHARLATMRAPANAQAVDAAVRELIRREAVDPTNPWYAFELGLIAHARGQSVLATASFRRALAKDHAYDFELLRMATPLDALDPEIADYAFERGYAFVMANGYVPTLATSALVAVTFLGVPDGAPLDPRTHYAALSRHAQRLEKLAPYSEGSAAFYEAMRLEAVRRGLASDVTRFTALTRHGAHTQTLGIVRWEAEYAGDLINAMLGLFFALFVLSAFKIARTYGPAPAGASLIHRISPLARFTRAERLGVVLGFIAFSAIGLFAARGVALIGQYASAPAGFMTGTPADADSLAFTREMTGTPGGDLLHAVALVSAGREADARPFLARSGRPEARAMLAKIDEPGIVPITAPRPDAIDEAHHARAMRRGGSVLRNPLTAPLAVFALAEGVEGVNQLHVVTAVVFALCFFALLGPYGGAPWPAPVRPAAYVASLLLPGAPRAYGALSFLFGGAFATFLLGLTMYVISDGVALNVLEAISRPEVGRFYGASVVLAPDRAAFIPYLPGAAVLLLHGVFVIFARRFDDPARGNDAASSETAAPISDASIDP